MGRRGGGGKLFFPLKGQATSWKERAKEIGGRREYRPGGPLKIIDSSEDRFEGLGKRV